MTARSARRLFAVSAAGVLLAGGAAIGTAGTASAAAPHQVTTDRGCFDRGFGNDCFGNGFHNGFRDGFFDNGGFRDGFFDNGGFRDGFFGPGFVPGFGGGVTVVVVN
ncbi:hypothetical protein [Streptomyces sp. NRRL S-31]|uniref:hypothetical protein n=1 Tax=Streptomyces sp. NRRL S-31 TaxID=1463898 RepID=UPI0004C7181A|nr:hypothetical protein [Streptomyces sp. NRRL S-31]